MIEFTKMSQASGTMDIYENLFEGTPEDIKKLIGSRLKEFKNFKNLGDDAWFSELCFCILTANSQARRAIEIQNFLGVAGFLHLPQEEIAKTIKSFGHRFHNNKAKYIVKARKFHNIKKLISKMNGPKAREFIVKNIKGLGYKEASHFLRNVGFEDVAIIDRHIIKFLKRNNLIDFETNALRPKQYLFCEEILSKFSKNLAKLDLIIWYSITGVVLK